MSARMIRQEFHIPKCGWTVTAYYAISDSPAGRVMEELQAMGCHGRDLHNAWRNMTDGGLDCGMTYTSATMRKTLVVIGVASSAAEFQNSLDHEKGHLCKHVSKALGIDPYGEDAEYLAGYVGQRMFEVARMFLCDKCRRHALE